MRRTILIIATGIAAVTLTAVSGAQTPAERPFPAQKVVQYFVSAQTVTAPSDPQGAGVLTNYFPQGSTVVFRAFAGESRTGTLLTPDATKYFYVSIPGQPNLKLTYTPSQKKGLPAPWPWTATWRVPADYPTGLTQVKVLLKTKADRYGSFVQIPVPSSQLTITKAG